MRRVILSAVLWSIPLASHAGIIGLLWSHAGNNVTISARLEGGRRVLRVEMPSEAPCKLQLYRHQASELDNAILKGGPEGQALGFGLWFDRGCYFDYFDRPQDQRPPLSPQVSEFDLERDLFSRPSLAKHRAAFEAGALKLAFCLQQSGPGAIDQGTTCPLVSRQDFDAGKVAYRSTFSAPKPVDLGLGAPKPLREDAVVALAYLGPAAKSGEVIPRRPTVSASIRAFQLDVAQAYNQAELGRDGKYWRFYFHRGLVVSEAGAAAAARRGEIVCELVLAQPKSLVGVEKTVRVSPAKVGRVDAGGGHSPWSYTPYEKDPEISRRGYWAQSIGFQPAAAGFSRPETTVSHVACMKPGWRTGADTVTAGELYEAVRLSGEPLIALYTDYPPDQKP